MASNIPTLDQLSQFQVNRPGAVEAIRQTLYDTTTYAAAGQTSLTFFQTPVGQGGKTLADTNMEAAGSLPNPKQFLIQSIEIHIMPAITPSNIGAAPGVKGGEFTNDMYAISTTGYLNLFIGSKSYLTEAPLMKFPPKTYLNGMASASDSTTAAANAAYRMDYAHVSGRPYYVEPNILLVPTQNFNITLNWAAAVPTISTKTARVMVVLDGILYRNSQ
jgi:hypothetical protein